MKLPLDIRVLWSLAGLTLLATSWTFVAAQETEKGKKDALQKLEEEARKRAEEGKIAPNNGSSPTFKRVTSVHRSTTLMKSGMTFPGYPDDSVDVDGVSVIPAKGELVQKRVERVLGATVYFAVYDRLGGRERPEGFERSYGTDRRETAENDTWDTGLANVDTRFVAGKNYTGSYSPQLDTRARYLYVYQVVNDRNILDPSKVNEKGEVRSVSFAADAGEPKVKANDVASFSLKLLVDPRYITSWGHFRGAAFTARVHEIEVENGQNKTVKQIAFGSEVPAGEKIKTSEGIQYVLSAGLPVQLEMPNKRFRRNSPSQALSRNLSRDFTVGQAIEGIADVPQRKAIGSGIGFAADGASDGLSRTLNVAAGKLAAEPEYVQILYFTGDDRTTASELTAASAEDDLATAVFRVDWNRNELIKNGSHSVVFGFTTDLPPVDQPIRIDDPDAAPQTPNIRTVGFSADGFSNGASKALGGGIVAAGNAPTPIPAPAAGMAPIPASIGAVGVSGGSEGMVGGLSGGQTGGYGGVGGGGWMGGTTGNGGLGLIAGRGNSGGGGSGGGRGGGNGGNNGKNGNDGSNGNGNDNENGNSQNNNQNNYPVVNVNVSQQVQVTQNNKQSQTQTGGCCCCNSGGGQVVPEPSTMLTGLAALPGLYFFWRRRTGLLG